MATLHDVRFPNESKVYRAARDKLLRAERDLRKRVEAVAALRRTLPEGGEIAEDYVFDGEGGPIKLSELFAGKPSLAVYSFMFGPKQASACPMCTAFLDSLHGAAGHIRQTMALAVAAKRPFADLDAFARGRGWSRLPLVSSAGNSYNRDYRGETGKGDQIPVLNVFTRRKGKIRHFWNTELFFVASEKGQHSRHVDMLWPVWNMFDLTPEGRPNWFPKLDYGTAKRDRAA